MAEDFTQIVDALVEALAHDERILNQREKELIGAILRHARSGLKPDQEAILSNQLSAAVSTVIANRVVNLIGTGIADRAFGLREAGREIGSIPPIAPHFPPPTYPPFGPSPYINPRPPWFPPDWIWPMPPEPPPDLAPHFPPDPVLPPITPEPDVPPITPPEPDVPPITPPEPDVPPTTPPEPDVPPIVPPTPQPPTPEPPTPEPPSPEPPSPEPPSPEPPSPDGPSPWDPPDPESSLWMVDPYVLEPLLPEQDLGRLITGVLAHEHLFANLREIRPASAAGHFESGQSKILTSVGDLAAKFKDGIASILPQILELKHLPPIRLSRIEAQVTATNDRESIRSRAQPSAELSFVYMFHREPRNFTRGELRIYNADRRGRRWVPASTYRSVPIRQNAFVLFPSRFTYDILGIRCQTHAFGDSLFTLTGWLYK